VFRSVQRWSAESARSPNDAIPRVTAEQLVALRRDMLRFARLQLRSPEAAEDLVQDTIEAALRGASSFAGRSSVKAWVFAILKNRMVDHIRQAGRTVSLSSLAADGEDWQEELERLFDKQGHWTDSARPTPWPDPEQARTEQEFWRIFEACLEHLPSRIARVFMAGVHDARGMMREVLGFEADEICRLLGVTGTNCHVMLHRARLKLRDCVGRGWGRPGGASC